MRKRKNFVGTFLLAVLCWGGLGYIVYQFSPNTTVATKLLFFDPKILFFLCLFLALVFSFSLLLQNTRRGILVALGCTSLALLRFFHLFHPLYIILIVSLVLTTELYFVKR